MAAPITYTAEPNLKLNIMQDHNAIAVAAAKRIAEKLRQKPDLVIGLATGATMEPVYAELVRMHKEEGLDFSKARFFNLDAYKGVPSTDRNSYDNQLRRLLINKVNAKAKNVNFVQGIDFDQYAYEAKIKAAGGIDVQLLGIGGEGHIGFNEVKSDINSRTREVKLSQRTREDNAMYFNKPGETVPDKAYTMGIGTILEAKEIITLANNPNKAWTMRNIMEPTGTHSEEHTSRERYTFQKLNPELDPTKIITDFDITRSQNARKNAKPVEELPARALHMHPNVQFYLDQEAASMLRISTLAQNSNLNTDQSIALLDKFTPFKVTVKTAAGEKKLLLPAKFDFYDPKVMDINEKFDRTNPTHIKALSQALANTTDVGVGAHQDDVEIMAGPQLLAASRDKSKGWTTIIVTDGAASKSILTGTSTSLTPKQLTDMRQHEQREAAQEAGTPVIQMKYPSAAINGHMGEGKRREATTALAGLFAAMPNLENAYGHNPIDKHDTHLGVLATQTAALRAAKPPKLKSVKAMEVWGGLTGIPESMLSMWPVETKEDMDKIYSLINKFQSQIHGQGRDYAETTVSRIRGHGGYVSNPHLANPPEGMVIGLDITDFTKGTSNDLAGLAHDILEKAAQIKKHTAGKYPVPDTPQQIGSYGEAILAAKAANKHHAK